MNRSVNRKYFSDDNGNMNQISIIWYNDKGLWSYLSLQASRQCIYPLNIIIYMRENVFKKDFLAIKQQRTHIKFKQYILMIERLGSLNTEANSWIGIIKYKLVLAFSNLRLELYDIYHFHIVKIFLITIVNSMCSDPWVSFDYSFWLISSKTIDISSKW